MLETCRARSPRSTRRTVDAEVFGRPESVTVTYGVQEALFRCSPRCCGPAPR